MQKLIHMTENLDIAKEALTHYHLDSKILNKLAFFRASDNSIYVYEDDDHLYYLRITPYDKKTEDEMISELHFMRYLNDHHIRVARPIMSKLNDEIFINKNNYYAVVFKEAKGHRLDKIDLNDDIIERLGGYLAKIHMLSVDYHNPFDHTSYITIINSFKTDHPKIQKEIEEVKEKINDLDLIYGKIHYDFEPDNIFYDSDTKRFELIDFNDSLYGYYMHDVMIALDEIDPKFHQSFLKGYHQIYKMETYDPSKLDILKRFDSLNKYFRLKYALSEQPEQKPDWMLNLISKITTIINDYESSFSK